MLVSGSSPKQSFLCRSAQVENADFRKGRVGGTPAPARETRALPDLGVRERTGIRGAQISIFANQEIVGDFSQRFGFGAKDGEGALRGRGEPVRFEA